MDADKILLDFQCYSENTHDSIGCGIYVSSIAAPADEIIREDIMTSLEESFWELLFEFEDSAQEAFDNGVISGTGFNRTVQGFWPFSLFLHGRR